MLTPGLTCYGDRIQYNSYDVTKILCENNVLEISVGPGWAVGCYGLKRSKNSWGEAGKYKGVWYASDAFVRYKTLNVVVHKDALPKHIAKKLGIK